MKLLRKRKMALITIVLCGTFLLLFSQAAFAENGVKLSISSESGAVGDEITVTVSIENAEETGGGEFELSYDPDIVEPVDIAKGAFVSDANNDQFMANLELTANRIKVMWVTPELDTADSGVVCTIVFELKDAGDSSLVFHEVVFAPDGVVLDTATSGKIESKDVDQLKQAAIDAANKAIADLKDPENIRLGDKDDVEEARALVNEAKDDHGAVDEDFDDLDKLENAEKMIRKWEAIKAADDAILALPTVEDLTLSDRPDVVAARALVNSAKADHGAVDTDFTYLALLTAAENRIKELEGLVPTPPTGAMTYLLPIGMLAILVGLIAYFKRSRLAAK